jgi:transposase-like protein
MDPQSQFCPNEACRDKGRRGAGNIRVHSQREQRYRCTTCKATFTATRGTPYFRLRTPVELVTVVLTLLCHGCPLQAIVAAYGLDERTVATWWERAGQHCQRLHGHLVQTGQVDLGHVQADELWVKLAGGRVWQAMALAVPSRLWLGGVISPHRDLSLIRTLIGQVRACASTLAVLICVDGLASYVRAVRAVFRVAVRTGRRGRPCLVPPDDLLLAQVVKHSRQHHLVGVTRRVVIGTLAAVQQILVATHTGTQIHTAYIERLNATFRACLAPLARRSRCVLHQPARLTAAMYLVGMAYNYCWLHESLRLPTPTLTPPWQERTPAMAAGLTDHTSTLRALLSYQIPPALWVTPKRRRRPPTPQPAGLVS